ncbi:MAG: ATP-binding protein [Candidatus Binatia bacterium]|nr:ATP-binding protein [Candidatus Binatia bacterium]MDG2008514.1 ATP-binding protein [Candidatus Binatia bacterium]
MTEAEKKSSAPAEQNSARISMDLAMQSLPLPLFGIDKEGRVAFMNRAAVETFGWKQSELVGRDAVTALAAPGLQENASRELRRAQDGESREQLGMLRRADGSLLKILFRLSPLCDENNWIHGVLAVVESQEGPLPETSLPETSLPEPILPDPVQITRQAKREKVLQDRVAAAEVSKILGASPFLDRLSEMVVAQMGDTSRLRGDFLATMSHELRTPLHAILGYAGLLQEGAFGELPPGCNEPLTRIERRAHELHDLITNTLSLSRLESEGEALHIEPVAVETFLGGLVRDAQRLRDSGESQISLEVAADLPVIETDVAKLKVVVRNLINNAIKFTDKGEIRIVASQNVGGISIQVQDSGVGMTSEEISHLFNAYTQNDTGRARGGVGLGLFIVQELTKRLGGQVDAESKLGAGSTFRINLPVRPPLHESS